MIRQAHRLDEELTVDQEILAYLRSPAHWAQAIAVAALLFMVIVRFLLG